MSKLMSRNINVQSKQPLSGETTCGIYVSSLNDSFFSDGIFGRAATGRKNGLSALRNECAEQLSQQCERKICLLDPVAMIQQKKLPRSVGSLTNLH